MDTLIFAVTTTIILSSTSDVIVTANNNLKTCLNGQEPDNVANITLSCPESQAIHVEEAVFRRNKWGSCVLLDDDCVEKTRVFHKCEGQNTCTRHFKTYTTTCGYSTVLFLSYDCLIVNHPTITTKSTSDATLWEMAENGGGRSEMSTDRPEQNNRNNRSSIDESGVIVGCVVAAIITVLALVVAITMTAKHLLMRDNSGDDLDNNSYQSHTLFHCSSCCPCFKLCKTVNEGQIKRISVTAAESAYKNVSTAESAYRNVSTLEKYSASSENLSNVNHSRSSVPYNPDHVTVTDMGDNQDRSQSYSMENEYSSREKLFSVNLGVDTCHGIDLKSAQNKLLHEDNNECLPERSNSTPKASHTSGNDSNVFKDKTEVADYLDSLPAKVTDLKYDAVSIANTESGTVC